MLDLGAGEKCVTVDNNGKCDITFDLNKCGADRQFFTRGQEKRIRSENTLGILYNKRGFLLECWRLLAPNGILRLENMSWGCPYGMHPVEAELLLRDAGFTKVRLITIHHIIYPYGNWIISARK